MTDLLTPLVQKDTQLAFLGELVQLAKSTIQPTRIVLFGSRARGDHHARSDVDLAFYFPDEHRVAWGRFVTTAREELRTLLELDLVDANCADPALGTRLAREGIVIYEQAI